MGFGKRQVEMVAGEVGLEVLDRTKKGVVSLGRGGTIVDVYTTGSVLVRGGRPAYHHAGSLSDLRSVLESLDGDGLCVVCMSEPPQVHFDCTHTVVCKECCKHLKRDKEGLIACPVCRAKVREGPGEEEKELQSMLHGLREEATRLAEQVKAIEALLQCRTQVRQARAGREEEALKKKEEERRRKEEEEREKREKEEEERRKREEEEAKRQEEERKTRRGRHCTFLLGSSHEVNKHFTPEVRCVATNGEGTIFIYDSGRWRYMGYIPPGLYKLLKGRSGNLPQPTYVALGSSDRYYIQFADGSAQWVGPDSMTEDVDTEDVATVAFGAEYDSYFVVYRTGGYAWCGIPDGLAHLLQSRQDRQDLTCVSLGDLGEWYVAARNGRWWAGGDDCTNRIPPASKNGVAFIDFGGQGTYFIRSREPLSLIEDDSDEDDGIDYDDPDFDDDPYRDYPCCFEAWY
eukprot:Sspe_Gene.55166::Locus_30373_Transcript_1_1_Confidence_1.000_Length_1480::g.55166::m.55166